MLINIVPTAVSDDPTPAMSLASIVLQRVSNSGIRRKYMRKWICYQAGEESGLPPILSDNNVLNRIDPPPDRD
jgi:hypothetical protein